MTDKNKSKLFIGFSLILISFICVVVVLYFMSNANRKNQEKITSLEVQLANSIDEKAAKELKPFDLSRTKREPIDLSDALAKAENVYGKAELNRKEGVLWVDRKASLFLITLGQANGMHKGSNLVIFDAEKKVGDVMVDTAFDLVSYVKPIEKTIKDFEGTYYRVVVKESP